MKKRILIAEDNPHLVHLMQKLLEFLGYDSIVANNGKEAVDFAAAHLPDLIILDIALPKLSGLEAATLIRQDPKTQSIPIIAATATALPEDKERCLQNSCDGYIAKPFTRDQLDSCIKNLLK
ncbi:MAG: response regulator [Candidatus Binatia bacterium]